MTSGIKQRFISLGIIAAIAIVSISSAVLYANHLLESPLARSVNFEIEKGAGLNTVLHRLASDDITPVPALLLKLYALITLSNGSVKAGEYGLSESLTTKTLLDKFRRGDVITYSITFPEGLRLSQWLELMKSEPAIAITLSKAADIDGKIEGLPDDLEGQFFPDTYSYTKSATDISILRRAHLRMQKVLDDAWSSRADWMTLASKREALILASIIEKETGVPADRATIAGVFVNRLTLGMKLQSDPTVIYAMDDFDGDLKRRHLRTPSPYNTYTIPRLPIGPICNPGAGSIAAALNPPESDYLYFVAKGDGTSYFSTSLAEHNAAVVQFQKAGRVKNYSSTPK
jgi:UPF0755 protein